MHACGGLILWPKEVVIVSKELFMGVVGWVLFFEFEEDLDGAQLNMFF